MLFHVGNAKDVGINKPFFFSKKPDSIIHKSYKKYKKNM